jgi:hypothetical protein
VVEKKMGVLRSSNPGTGKADEINGVEASTYVASRKFWARSPNTGLRRTGEI